MNANISCGPARLGDNKRTLPWQALVHVSSPSVHTSPTGKTLHLDEESSVQQTLQDLPVSHRTAAQTFVTGMASMCQHMLEQSQADLQTRYILLPPFPQYSYHRLFPEVTVHPGHLVLVHLVEFGVDLLFRIDDVFPQDLLGNGFNPVCVGKNDLTGVPIHCLLATWVVLDMAANNEPGKHFILQESNGLPDTEDTHQIAKLSGQLQLSIPTAASQAQHKLGFIAQPVPAQGPLCLSPRTGYRIER